MLGSVVVGWISVPLTGVAAFVLGVAPASVANVRVARADHPLLLREASHDPHPRGVVAGELSWVQTLHVSARGEVRA